MILAIHGLFGFICFLIKPAEFSGQYASPEIRKERSKLKAPFNIYELIVELTRGFGSRLLMKLNNREKQHHRKPL